MEKSIASLEKKLGKREVFTFFSETSIYAKLFKLFIHTLQKSLKSAEYELSKTQKEIQKLQQENSDLKLDRENSSKMEVELEVLQKQLADLTSVPQADPQSDRISQLEQTVAEKTAKVNELLDQLKSSERITESTKDLCSRQTEEMNYIKHNMEKVLEDSQAMKKKVIFLRKLH